MFLCFFTLHKSCVTLFHKCGCFFFSWSPALLLNHGKVTSLPNLTSYVSIIEQTGFVVIRGVGDVGHRLSTSGFDLQPKVWLFQGLQSLTAIGEGPIRLVFWRHWSKNDPIWFRVTCSHMMHIAVWICCHGKKLTHLKLLGRKSYFSVQKVAGNLKCQSIVSVRICFTDTIGRISWKFSAKGWILVFTVSEQCWLVQHLSI